MRIPLLLHIQIKEREKKKVRLFIPLFLIWLLLLPILILAIPFVLIAAAITWHKGYGRAILAIIPLFLWVLGSLPGLYIQIEKPENKTLFYVQ